MKRISLIFVFCAFLSLLPAVGQVKMLHPHEEIQNAVDTLGCTKVFLAGTIDMGNSIDWQKELNDYFALRGGKWLLYNPRQKKWDATIPGEMDYQVNWELSHLEQSDYIIMNILGNSKSPISLLEMGLFARSGKMAVVCPKEYYRYDNVRITCERYQVPLYQNLDDMLSHTFK